MIVKAFLINYNVSFTVKVVSHPIQPISIRLPHSLFISLEDSSYWQPTAIVLLMAAHPYAESWCHTHLNVIKFSHIWTIDNFSYCREDMGDAIKSCTFTSEQDPSLMW